MQFVVKSKIFGKLIFFKRNVLTKQKSCPIMDLSTREKIISKSLPRCTKESRSKEKVQVHKRKSSGIQMRKDDSQALQYHVQRKKWKSTKEEVEKQLNNQIQRKRGKGHWMSSFESAYW